jgi:hypothetical protein
LPLFDLYQGFSPSPRPRIPPRSRGVRLVSVIPVSASCGSRRAPSMAVAGRWRRWSRRHGDVAPAPSSSTSTVLSDGSLWIPIQSVDAASQRLRGSPGRPGVAPRQPRAPGRGAPPSCRTVRDALRGQSSLRVMCDSEGSCHGDVRALESRGRSTRLLSDGLRGQSSLACDSEGSSSCHGGVTDARIPWAQY